MVTGKMDAISIALSVIAGISLLVGGIGVMNIMLGSITVQIREIGTRKAIGAINANIRIRLMAENTVICLIGGFFGHSSANQAAKLIPSRPSAMNHAGRIHPGKNNCCIFPMPLV